MGLEAILFEMFTAVDAADAILSIQNSARTAVRFERRRRGGKLLERAPGFLTTGAKANGAGGAPIPSYSTPPQAHRDFIMFIGLSGIANSSSHALNCRRHRADRDRHLAAKAALPRGCFDSLG
jgi:hypothetical protein